MPTHVETVAKVANTAWLRASLGVLLFGSACQAGGDASVAGESAQSAASPLVAATYYVSPAGSGSACSAASPCSLQKAQSLVRAATAAMRGDLDVRLASGTYRLQSTFALDASAGDSGKNGFRVIYEAVPGGHPVISGGMAVTGWTRVSNSSLWKANVPAGFNTRQLYVNGLRATRARGALPVTLTQVGDASGPTGYVASSNAMASWGNSSDIEFVYELAFEEDRCDVQSISGTSIVMKQPCFYNSAARPPDYGYNIGAVSAVENAYEVLDQPGEWYLNRTTHTIYYIPRGEDMTRASVEAASLQTLWSGVGTAGNPLQNVTIRGLTFSYGGWLGASSGDGFSEMQANYLLTGPRAANTQGGCDFITKKNMNLGIPLTASCPYGDYTPTPANVTFVWTTGLTLERNVFTHLGGAGAMIGVGGGALNTTVIGNVFSDISGHGLHVGGVHDNAPSDPSVLPTNTVIKNNWVTRIGADYAGAVGIFQGYTRSSLIEHNQVNDVPYTGISTGWGWGRNTSETAVSGNVIRANLVFDHMRDRDDGGGIYVLGRQGADINSGLQLAYNVVRGQRHSNTLIYTDAGTNFVTLDRNAFYDNVVSSGNWGGCRAPENVAYGNSVAVYNFWQASLWSQQPDDPAGYSGLCGGADNLTLNGNARIQGPNDDVGEERPLPGVTVKSAGLEAAYEDIRGDVASRVNLAYRKPAQAFDSHGVAAAMQPGSEPGAAVDADTSSVAQATASIWQLHVDLGGLQLVDRFRVTMPAGAAFHVNLSTDGLSFTNVGGSTLRGTTQEVKVKPTVARYVRIVSDGSSTSAGPMGISELGVYGPPDLALRRPAIAQFIDGSPADMQPASNAYNAVDGIGSTYAQATNQYRWQLLIPIFITTVNHLLVAMPAAAWATAFHVDVSANGGASWTTVASESGRPSGTTDIPITPILADTVRIVADLPSGPGQTGGQMAISRASVFGPTNLAADAFATANYLDGSVARMQPFGDAANAVDGDPTTYAQATDQYPWALTIDLGSTQPVNSLRFLMPAAAFATAFHVDAWAAGQTPRTTTSASGDLAVAVGGEIELPMPGTQIRFVRIVADAPNGPGQRGGQMAISEVIVY